MYRLLIADTSDAMAKLLGKQLKDEIEMHRCNDNSKLLRMINALDPDILYLDMQMLGIEGMTTLQLLRSSGRKTKLIISTSVWNEMIIAQLMQLQVSHLLRKPCASGYIVTCVRELCFRLDHPKAEDWCLENEIDNMLLKLGFRMGPNRYKCVFEAVLERYRCPESSMKELYIDVAKRCGGNYQRIEKAVRDAVEDAYSCSDPDVWNLYFQSSKRKGKPYPGNEEFIARLAGALIQHARVKKPIHIPRKEAQ